MLSRATPDQAGLAQTAPWGQPRAASMRNSTTGIPRIALASTLPAPSQSPDGDSVPDPSDASTDRAASQHSLAQQAASPATPGRSTERKSTKTAKNTPLAYPSQTPAPSPHASAQYTEPVDRPGALAPAPVTPDADGFDLCPDPLAAQTPADLVKALSQFRIWAGEPSFREMERRCDHEVAASTMCMALTCEKLPKLPVIHAILTSCGASWEHHQAFATAWRRIRMN